MEFVEKYKGNTLYAQIQEPLRQVLKLGIYTEEHFKLLLVLCDLRDVYAAVLELYFAKVWVPLDFLAVYPRVTFERLHDDEDGV